MGVGTTVGEVVHSRSQGPVLVVTIDRPHARNAIDLAVAHGIAAAMDHLDGSDDLRAGVLTGTGGSFCAGADLRAVLRGEVPVVASRGFGGLVERPPDKPLVAAVEGWAVGGGLELALACDLVVASTDARLGFPEVTRGLVASAGGMVHLPQRIPRAIAMEMLLTGRPITADRAHALGLVNVVVAAGTALDGALGLAGTIAANGPLAVRTSKAVARAAADWPHDDWADRQRAAVDRVRASRDAREGATAFAEKRPPVWSGD